MALTFKDVAKLLSEQHKVFCQQITQTFEDFQFRSLIPMPEFSGDPNKDVKEFLRQFFNVATIKNNSNEQKAEILPLLLTGNARAWINSIPELATRTFEDLSEALVKRFHLETDIFLLRLQLLDRKQLPGESVLQFASKICKLCLHLEVSLEDSIFHFVNSLCPELRNYVVIQRPKTFSEEETLAKLKEALQDEKPLDRTDEILSAIATLQKSSADPNRQVAGYNSAPYSGNDYPEFGSRNNKNLSRDQITQIAAEQLGQEQGENYGPRKTFHDRPICDYCGKNGHVS